MKNKLQFILNFGSGISSESYIILKQPWLSY